jgi:hypothetical protein
MKPERKKVMKIKLICPVIALAALVASSVCAEEAVEAKKIPLPLGMEWCQTRAEVGAVMKAPQDVAGDVLESTMDLWKLDGFATAEFEADALILIRLRFYGEPDGPEHTKIRKALEKDLGEGATDRRRMHWIVGDGQKVTMRAQAEQVFVTYEIPWNSCEGDERKPEGLTDQEKADMEDVREKRAVEWDPYEADDVHAPAVDRKAAEEKKAEEKPEEEAEEATPALDDGDIEW